MLEKAFLAAAATLSLAAGPALSAPAKTTAGDSHFRAKLSKDAKVLHALNRLTFGPRPGDVERLRAIGLEKWIDQQLNPSRILENPSLGARLEPLQSLRMSSGEMATTYPPTQVLRAMAAGRTPFPDDPKLRKTFERLAERYKPNAAQNPAPTQESLQSVAARLLSEEQARVVRSGSAEEKLQLFFSLPEDQQDALLDAMPQGARREILARAPAELRRRIMLISLPQEVVAHDLIEGKLYRALYSNRQLEEVLVDFWFNHFNVDMNKGQGRFMVTAYERDAIRPHVLGKFHDLLRATAESPAMLFYLDNWQSVDPGAFPAPGRARRGLNENYARELLELHTLGVDGGYTQQDIIEVARCFTGWTIRDPRGGGGFEFNERGHDKAEKTVLGVKIPAGRGVEDGLQVLEILLRHPSTARYVSQRLAQRFVADQPPAALVERMARTFAETNGDLRRVMRTMIESREFWSKGAYRAKLKSPLEMVASAARAMNADVTFAFGLAEQIGRLGQPLYRKQEPTGYSNSSEEWLNSTGLLARMNFARALASNSFPGVKVETPRLAVSKQKQDPAKAVERILLAPTSKQTRAAIAEAVASPQKPSAKPADPMLMAAGLILGSPEFQRR